MVAMPASTVRAGAMAGPLVASSAPLTVTVAPTMTALLGSTTVILRVPVAGACAAAATVGIAAASTKAASHLATRDGPLTGRDAYVTVPPTNLCRRRTPPPGSFSVLGALAG